MEHLQNQHLNEPLNHWTPWQADEELLYAILTGQLVPPAEEAPPETEPAIIPKYAQVA